MRVVLGLLLLAGLGLVCAVPDIINPDASNVFHLTSGNGAAYFFNGSLSQQNPTLNMTAGTTYYISIEFASTNHPFGFSNTNTGLAVQENGLVNNGSCTSPATGAYVSAGTVPYCVLSYVAPNVTTTSTPLYYHCTVHPAMVGAVQVNALAGAAGNPTTASPTTPPPTGNTTAGPTTAGPTTPAPGNATTAPPTTAISADNTNTFHVTGAVATQGWIFTSNGAQYINPTLNVAYGKTYTISIEFPTPTHPFGLNTDSKSLTLVGLYGLGGNTTCGGSATAGYITGTACTITFTPPANTPQPLYYHCAYHAAMVGQVVVSGLPNAAGLALVPGFAVLIAVIAGLFAQ